jgi:hypothetical protein
MFTPRRSDQHFCCNACRQAHHKAKHYGVRLSVPRTVPPEVVPSMSEREVVEAFGLLREATAIIDSASLHGPKRTRGACALVADRVMGALGEVGLL